MIILEAFQTTTVLPNPQDADTENGVHSLDMKRAMDGTKYTYVKSTDRRRLTYEFRLTRMKALELRAFILAYYDSDIKMTNHKDEVWEVKFVNNPFELSTSGRDSVSIQLVFEGRQL